MNVQHPKTNQTLAEMEKWAQKSDWGDIPTECKGGAEESCGCACCQIEQAVGTGTLATHLAGGEGGSYKTHVVHFIPENCYTVGVLAYCAFPSAVAVREHRKGECSMGESY